ncbi:MAG TPA: sulfur oxidation c-type cytochrome SoxX [Rhodobacteraceae bacterium]|jgi:sulfur-oxidizing protein SoxX|nr:sulfur oxidation c-type cytochrome SoxX [Paracoccaceae bacterium]HBM69312.1 sulfur oxidation c-type cytochrome SoxX [Paracoccaceae bacterium]
MGRFSLMTLVCMLAGSSAFAADVMPANVVFNDGVVGAALTAQAGDPAAGRKVFMNRKLGNCLACHANEDMSDQSFHGEVGPALDGVADRWEAAELRGIVVNSKMMFEGTIMPAFYKDAGFERNLKNFQGKSILNAQQVEDVVAYLLTLKEE